MKPVKMTKTNWKSLLRKLKYPITAVDLAVVANKSVNYCLQKLSTLENDGYLISVKIGRKRLFIPSVKLLHIWED